MDLRSLTRKALKAVFVIALVAVAAFLWAVVASAMGANGTLISLGGLAISIGILVRAYSNPEQGPSALAARVEPMAEGSTNCAELVDQKRNDDDLKADFTKLVAGLQSVGKTAREWKKAASEGDEAALRELREIAGGDLGFLDRVAKQTEQAAGNFDRLHKMSYGDDTMESSIYRYVSTAHSQSESGSVLDCRRCRTAFERSKGTSSDRQRKAVIRSRRAADQ
jgi:hypothetical protein